MTKERSHLDIHLGGGVTVTSSTESRALGGSETLASLGVQVHKVAQTSTVSTGDRPFEPPSHALHDALACLDRTAS